jgi:hypothetical protein
MANVTPIRPPKSPRRVLQILVVLPGTDPLVWRRIQVPARYSFWDLHVAIQDAMGWEDRHLHEFEIVDPRAGAVVRIGIPDDEMPDERPCLASWTVPIADHLGGNDDGPVRYTYDFGDDWKHLLACEDVVEAGRGRYPRCLAGAGACPPEDVGGRHGYNEFVAAIADPNHPERDAMLEWVGRPFDPYAFDAAGVTFDDPKKRWRRAFGR